MALQALIVQFGSVAFHVSEGGLNAKFWGLSLGLGVGTLPWQQVINVIYAMGLNYKGYRMKKRLQKSGSLNVRQTDNGGH